MRVTEENGRVRVVEVEDRAEEAGRRRERVRRQVVEKCILGRKTREVEVSTSRMLVLSVERWRSGVLHTRRIRID